MKNKVTELINGLNQQVSDNNRDLEISGIGRNNFWFIKGEISATLKIVGYLENILKENEE